MPKIAPKQSQYGPEMAPKSPHDGEDGSKMSPRWRRNGSKMAQRRLRWPLDGPRWPQDAPRWPNMAATWSKVAPMGPKIAQTLGLLWGATLGGYSDNGGLLHNRQKCLYNIHSFTKQVRTPHVQALIGEHLQLYKNSKLLNIVMAL
jgi:hypothetical protein